MYLFKKGKSIVHKYRRVLFQERIDCWLFSSQRYVMHFQNENKFNNVWTMYKNDGEMGKRLLTANVKAWRVWQGRQMLPFVAATTSNLVLEIYV